ncbi:hypothetical protein [Paractinoplanes rishiriensis]|uniref:Uncharacterized protein n=1 Tax=Paractinoplanes rishiriensis TaxID=1050105 RepID=A0A919N2C8_9ACTN|nr:hypothetical protein [Actinoplanes rishiriensis]GIE99457.1 hypothetical protein Ari01nite_69220 [Actinoplanes rishiriensis]
MSFDLGVLAIDGWTDVAEVVAMVERCRRADHAEGDLDPRIVGFYERLRAEFPDHPPGGDDSPWMSTPLDLGIDHVFMSLSFGVRSNPALELIQDLAADYGLTIWDPQDGSARRAVRPPSRDEVAGWWRDLLDGRCGEEEIQERVRPWIEEDAVAVDDPITAMGLQHLFGYGVTRDQLERWLDQGKRHDADPAGWQRDRFAGSVLAVRRDRGVEHARALALQLESQGRLSAADVARLLG